MLLQIQNVVHGSMCDRRIPPALALQAHLLYAFPAQAHAKHLEARSQQANTQPEQVQAQAQAQSFQAKAHSLEKAAEAQNLQVSMASLPKTILGKDWRLACPGGQRLS